MSANATRRTELERLSRVSVEERILVALSVRSRMTGLRPSPLPRYKYVHQPPSLLEAAEDLARLLQGQRVEAVVIRAVALAAYHYVRQTEDVDMEINASAKTLKNLTQIL